MSNQNKEKREYDHSNPVYKSPDGNQKNYGTVYEYNYVYPYDDGNPSPPDKIPESTQKPENCVICDVKNNNIYWSFNPETLELEKKYVFNWHCLNCIFTLSEKYDCKI